MDEHNILGKWGEEIAYDYFASHGYAIVGRNVRTGKRYNEIDLIVQKGQRIIFVEVKTRSSGENDPLSAITPEKSKRLIRAAVSYISAARPPYEPQFDVFLVIGTPQKYKVEHFEDVFIPPLHTR